jgi:hypothetical protein
MLVFPCAYRIDRAVRLRSLKVERNMEREHCSNGDAYAVLGAGSSLASRQWFAAE